VIKFVSESWQVGDFHKTDRHDIIAILLKESLKTMTIITTCVIPKIPKCSYSIILDFDLIFGVLTPLSAIFQLYHGDQF